MLIDNDRLEKIRDEIANPHDCLFNRTFGKPANIKHFIEKNLLPGKLENLKIETLRKSSETHVDPQLAKNFMDLVYTVEMEASLKRGTVSLLLEHKSTVVT